MIHAKQILKEKFWLLKDGEINIGTIEFKKDQYHVKQEKDIKVFESKQDVIKNFDTDIFQKISTKIDAPTQHDVEGFPTKVKPFNVQWFDKTPTFTKTEKSHDRYCAGYYGVRFEGGIFPSNNPKLITLTEKCLEFVGPFRSEMELNINLSTFKKETKTKLKDAVPEPL